MSDLPIGSHICIEVQYEGWSWYCIGGTWYEQCHVLDQLWEVPDDKVPGDVQLAYDKYLDEHSKLVKES